MDQSRDQVDNEVRSQSVSVPHEEGIHVVRAVTIQRPAEQLYAYWHDLSNMPQIFKYVESVQPIDNVRSHWTMKLPTQQKVEFDSELYTDVPNEVISWRSLSGAELKNAGSVRFEPAPDKQGTEVRLTVEFVPPAGALGKALLSMFTAAPSEYIGQFLREFKQYMETGEKATTEGQSSGRAEDAEDADKENQA